VLSLLRSENSDLRALLQGWVSEQRQRDQCIQEHLTQLQSCLDTVQGELSFLNAQCNTCLDAVESLTQSMSTLLKGYTANLEHMSVDESRQLARCLLQEQCLRSEFGVPYQPGRYVSTLLQNTLSDFSRQCLSGKTAERSLFVLLAQMGLGKTWNAAHFAHSLCAADTPPATPLGSAYCLIPFFIILRGGIEKSMGAYFNVSTPTETAERCRSLHARGKTPVFVLDGLDEVTSAEGRQDALQWVTQFLQAVDGHALVLLTCRTSAWTGSAYITAKERELGAHLFSPDGVSSTSHSSVELSEFSDAELPTALGLYGLDTPSLPPPLREMCRKPYILGLIAEYAGRTGTVPDPRDVPSFMPVFRHPLDKSADTILHRMGIVKDVIPSVFGPFLTLLGDVSASIDQTALTDVYGSLHWETLVTSGLLDVTRTGFFSTEYSIVPLYRPYVRCLMQEQGITGIKKVTRLLGLLSDPAGTGTEVESAMWSLNQIVSEAGNVPMVYELNAPAVVVSALVKHMGSAMVVADGARVLLALGSKASERLSGLVAVGAVPMLLQAVQEHSSDAVTACCVLRCLRALADEAPIRPVLQALKCHEVMLGLISPLPSLPSSPSSPTPDVCQKQREPDIVSEAAWVVSNMAMESCIPQMYDLKAHLHVVNAMQLHPQMRGVVSNGGYTLWRLARGDVARQEGIVDAGALSSLLWGLQLKADHERSRDRVLKCMAELTQADANLPEMHALNCHVALVGVMQEYPTLNVYTAVASILRRMTGSAAASPVSYRRLVSAGILPLLLKGLDTICKDNRLASADLLAVLRNIAECHPELLYSANSHVQILSALTLHSDSEDMVVQAAGTLHFIALLGADTQEALLEAGAGSKLQAMLKKHCDKKSENTDLACHVLNALTCLSGSDTNRAALHKHKCHYEVVRTMSLHRESSAVILAATKYLCRAMQIEPGGSVAIDRSLQIGKGAILPVLTSSLPLFLLDASVTQAILETLRLLAYPVNGSNRLVESGGLSHVLTAMRVHALSARVTTLGAKLICNLATRVQSAGRTDTQILELLVAGIDNHLDCVSACQYCIQALYETLQGREDTSPEAVKHRRALNELNCSDVVLKALQKHVTDKDITKRGTRILEYLAVEDESCVCM
ncbi:hypothetical protein KIPB_006107, partial [Kipferlia bialata]